MGAMKMRKGLWSPDEDEKLTNCIARHRTGSWSDIARKAGLQRCGKSCRRRWMNHLRPDLKRDKFSPQEIDTIIALHTTLGNKWSEIATHLVGRTDNDIKNLWNTQLKGRLKSTQRSNHHGGESHTIENKSDLETLLNFPFPIESKEKTYNLDMPKEESLEDKLMKIQSFQGINDFVDSSTCLAQGSPKLNLLETYPSLDFPLYEEPNNGCCLHMEASIGNPSNDMKTEIQQIEESFSFLPLNMFYTLDSISASSSSSTISMHSPCTYLNNGASSFDHTTMRIENKDGIKVSSNSDTSPNSSSSTWDGRATSYDDCVSGTTTLLDENSSVIHSNLVEFLGLQNGHHIDCYWVIDP